MTRPTTRALGAAAVLIASLSVIAAPTEAAPAQAPAETSALTPAGPVGSVYVPITPCRVVDTRFGGGGKFANGDQRVYTVSETARPLAPQGGKAGGCGLPDGAFAIEASVTAVSPENTGYFRAWPTQTPPPTATFLNYTKNQGTTNTGAITLGTNTLCCLSEITVKNFGGPAHYVIDVQGYFADPRDIGALYVPLTPCRVLDTRFGGGGKLASQDQRSYQTAGTGPNFAAQGGKPGGCGIPDGAEAIEASITATAPATSGFFRAWPAGSPEPTATFLNYTRNQGTTNTGAITLAPTGTNDLTIKNFNGPAHYVIDVQGYFVNAADLPPGVSGSVYVPAEPCRVLDTRFGGGGKLASLAQRSYQTAGTGPNFATQGGQPGGCAIPDGVRAIEASITATAPATSGYFRAWPAGSPEPTATFINFTKNQGTTNTGAITLAPTGTNDLTIKNFNGPTHYVIDVQGHYQTINTTRITDGNSYSYESEASGDGRFLAFSSISTDLTPEIDIAPSAADLFLWDRSTGVTRRITNGNGRSYVGDISVDGEVVTFSSSASNLVAGDTNGQSDIFVWVQSTGAIQRITNGNGASTDPTMDKTGETIAFLSKATNLAPGGNDGNQELFLWSAGATTELLDGNVDIFEPDMSNDGELIVFSSLDTDLVSGDNNGRRDVFLLNRDDGSAIRLTNGNGDSLQPGISAEGNAVVFSSAATNLVANPDPNGSVYDVFLRDLQSNVTTRVTSGNDLSGDPSVDSAGSVVAFRSEASNVIPGDPQAGIGFDNAFLWKRSTGTTERITATNAGLVEPKITDDGSRVFFRSVLDDVVPGDPDCCTGVSNLYVWGPRT